LKAQVLSCFLALLPPLAGAQTPPVDDSVGTAARPFLTVPALTPVFVRLAEEVSTRMHKPGDRFRIAVAEDVRIGDAVVIPAGCVGEGEVIDAAKPGFGGKAAKLVLAARYVLVGEAEVRLRSFVLGAVGKDYSNGALATSFVIGPLAMFVHGGDVVVPRDTIGSAKTAMEIRLPVVAAAGPPPERTESSSQQ
jgi:hypothetical protein